MFTKATIALSLLGLLTPLAFADPATSIAARAVARARDAERIEEPELETVDESADETVDQSADDTPDDSADETAPKPVKKPSKKPAKKPAQRTAVRPTAALDPEPARMPAAAKARPVSLVKSVDEQPFEEPVAVPFDESELIGTPMAEQAGLGCSNGCCANPTNCCLTPCTDFFRQRCFVYGEYLWMKSFGPDMVHATQQNAAPAGQGTVPFGTAQNLIQPWAPAFRVGGGLAFNNCSSISVSYMQFFSNVSDTIGLPAGTTFGSVVSSVLTPGTINSGTTFSRIEAVSSVNFRVADLMYNRLIFGTPNAYMNWSAGLRYGHLHQNFEQNAEFAQPNNPQFTTSSINFDGVGPRIGLDGRRRLGATCFSGYGQGSISTLFGDTVTGYSQTDTLTTAVLASSNWQSFRVVPVLDFELGLSWTSCGGHLRVGGGYYTAFWFNAITTPQYISAVQNNHFISLGDTVTFTGAVLHAEARF